MTWVLVWTVLALGALAVAFLLGRRLWRQVKALTRELGVASDRLAEITDRLGDLSVDPGRDALGDEPDSVRSQGRLRRR